jgi:hypothetical protein
MSWLRAVVRSLAAGVVLAPHPPVTDGLPSRSAQPDRTLEETSAAEGLRVMRGRVESVDPVAGRVRVGDALGHRTLAVHDRTLVMTPRGAANVEALTPGDEVRATFDVDGRLDVIELLPAPRKEAPGRPSRLPRVPSDASTPSTPDPRSDRAPGDVPGNRIPRRAPP